MEFKSLSEFNNKDFLLGRVLPVALLLGAAFFLAYPAYNARNDSHRSLQEYRQSIVAMQGNINKLPALQQEKSKLLQEIEQTRSLLYTEKEVSRFVGEISEIARRYNVQITSSRPVPVRDHIPEAFRENYDAYEIELELESEFSGLSSFFSELYETEKKFKLLQFSVSGRKNRDTLNQISLNILVVSLKEGKEK